MTIARNAGKLPWFRALTENVKEWIRREIVDDDPYDNEMFDKLMGFDSDPAAYSQDKDQSAL